MTVYVPENRAEFLGNGVTTQFDFGFRFFADSNIRVTRVDADGLDTVLSAGYVVAGAGSLNGGSVTITSPVLATGERLIVERILPAVQETDIRNQGRFFPEVHEDAWDYLTMLIQQNTGGLRQAIRVAASDPEPARLPGAASRANLLMGFNSAGDPVPVSPVGGSAADLALQLLNALDPAKGAQMIGYRGRTVREKLDQWIDVRDFGAKGDFDIPTETGTDDTAAIQDALDYLKSVGGGVLRFPKGQYRITSALSYENAPIVIVGDGIDQTLIIQTTAAENAFDFVHTDVPPWVDGVLGHGGRIYSTYFQDLSITTTKQAGKAINISIPPSTQNNTWVSMKRVAIKSLLYVTVGFQYGLFCHNVNGTKLDEFYFMGDAGNTSVDAAAPFYSQTAIVLEGDNAYGFISHYWRGVTVYAANRAVHITNHYEGIYLQQFEFGGVGEGIIVDATTFTNFHVENGHIDFKAQAIYAKNISGLRIVNVDTLKHGQSPGAHTVVGPNIHIELCNGASIIGGRCWSFTDVGNCNGIEIVDSIEFAIEGVDIKDMAITNRGISVSNGSKGVISGNTIKNVAAGIVISNASSEIVVANNVISEMAGTPGARFGVTIDSPATNITAHGNSCVTDVDLAVANNSAGNYIYDNTGGGAQFAQFANGDTTPAVDATGARTFTTANTGATSITAFDGGYVGLEINVIALDANTTIVDSGAVVPILTKSGANIAMALNDTARFVRGPGAWYEV